MHRISSLLEQCLDFSRLAESDESASLEVALYRIHAEYESSRRFVADALQGLASHGIDAVDEFASILAM